MGRKKRRERPLVYVCAPFAAETKDAMQANAEAARKYARLVAECNMEPVATHLMGMGVYDDGDPEERERALYLSAELVKICDIVMVFGDTVTRGMNLEIRTARQHGIWVAKAPKCAACNRPVAPDAAAGKEPPH
jgi:hypothetical protein